MANDIEPEANQPGHDPDPLTSRSMSGIMLVTTLLTFGSLVWALYDELISQRPWKRHQAEFVELYTAYLKKLGPQQAAVEKRVYASPEFRAIEEKLKAAEGALAPRLGAIDQELGRIRQSLATIKDPFQDARARIAALSSGVRGLRWYSARSRLPTRGPVERWNA